MTVFGSEDPNLPVLSADKLGSLLPDPRNTVIEGGGLGQNERHAEVSDDLAVWFGPGEAWLHEDEETALTEDMLDTEEVCYDAETDSGEVTLPAQPRTGPRAPSGPPCRMFRIGMRRCP